MNFEISLLGQILDKLKKTIAEQGKKQVETSKIGSSRKMKRMRSNQKYISRICTDQKSDPYIRKYYKTNKSIENFNPQKWQ